MLRVTPVPFRTELPGSTAVRRASKGDSSPERYLACERPFLGRIPVLLVEADELRGLQLDHRAGFLVSLIDGASNIETMLDLSAMPKDETLRMIENLLGMGVIAFV
jgi:hypothetical protein